MTGKETINIVWFRKDLRITDHAPLVAAQADGIPTLLIYIYEPSFISSGSYANRHWRFITQSIDSFSRGLRENGLVLHVFHKDAEEVFEYLCNAFHVKSVYSHHEVGLKITRERDVRVGHLLESFGVEWSVFGQDGIVRNATTRIGWDEHWKSYMESPLVNPDLKAIKRFRLSESHNSKLEGDALPVTFYETDKNFQRGGYFWGKKYLSNFLAERSREYIKFLSSPYKSRLSCSRFSPYLAHGCLGAREVYQSVSPRVNESKHGHNLEQFLVRIYWRSHYMQKLESEWELEFQPMNRELIGMNHEVEGEFMNAWKTGNTGYPMIDASMRSLIETGYLNFRMRAMLVTFATFTMWLDWKEVARHLSRLFLDFEPGVHYGQIQVQAGLSGYHTLRIFNPIAQSQKYDKSGFFLKRFLPELESLPAPMVFTPWMMSKMEEEHFGIRLGKDYPKPILDFDISSRIAKEYYWKRRNAHHVQQQLPKIWERHCSPQKIEAYLKVWQENRSRRM